MNHSGRNSLQRHFRERYCNVTKDCIMAFLETCIDCPRRKRHGGRFFSQKPRLGIEFNGIPIINKYSDDENDEENENQDSYLPNNNDNDETLNGPMANASVVSTTPLDLFRSIGSNNGMKRVYSNQNNTNNFNTGFTQNLGDLSKGQVIFF